MASSSNDPDSLVTLHFHDFRVERMRHWWTLLGEDDHADIVGFFGKFPPFMRLQVDRGLLEALASLLGPDPLLLFHWGSGSCPYYGGFYVQRLLRPEETWRKANISLDLLTKYFSRSGFPVKLARDFIAGKKGWKKFRINAFKIAFAGDRERGFRCSAHSFLQLWFCSHLRHFYRLQTPYHFERHTVSQTVNIALPFTGNSRDWASYLLDLPLGEWSWKVTWGPAVWKPWTHCALFDGVPLPGVWGCTGYYPSLALRQFGGVQYPPRLGDLDAVTFDYIPSEDMWRLLSRVEVIWEGRLSEVVLIEDGLLYGQGTSHSLVSRSLRVSASTGQPERVTVLERELEEAQTELLSLRLARAAEREASAARVESLRSTLHHNSVAVANLRRDLEQLEISEDAKEQLEETLAEAREQLETEQAERTRVQDELDSLRSYTQALVDPATGRPQDIVALRRALDASEEALTSARTSMGVMRVQISVLQGDNGGLCRLSWIWCMMLLSPMLLGSIRRVSLWSLLFHQINQVMDSLGARARAVWEEHDEGDPALSTALGRFCRETCIRLGH
uniref:Aminotransferase-like plant mobile domain-containing protein n=1 Tax=Fagus sylvatica TaxID=28930 RepID=A0A2N9GEQ5_FAGSY